MEIEQQFGKIPAINNRLNARTSTAMRPANRTENVQTKFRTITMNLNPKIADELEKLNGKEDWNKLMQELLELRKQKLESEKPEPVKTESRHIPEKIKQYAVAKTRGQCAFSACIKPYKILHHTQRWALENIHDPDRLVPLCTKHERIFHNGLIENEEKSPEEWKILAEPVWWDFKNTVDKTVMKYRKI